MTHEMVNGEVVEVSAPRLSMVKPTPPVSTAVTIPHELTLNKLPRESCFSISRRYIYCRKNAWHMTTKGPFHADLFIGRHGTLF